MPPLPPFTSLAPPCEAHAPAQVHIPPCEARALAQVRIPPCEARALAQVHIPPCEAHALAQVASLTVVLQDFSHLCPLLVSGSRIYFFWCLRSLYHFPAWISVLTLHLHLE